ncbi:type III restriction-modification system methyltransferase [Corynebacterium falsenii DSM 44353]|uniref:site-specific DNA-methyltransferase n=1 Tax=Corynebacterium falsenii TaxID=108486 RepID=UPI0003E966CD|nr:site-specific DNA-methyltransferase [Corynebacterium falsenii]AHI02831.1 type III restriction-modification system methyltransferase [Corynebacterium falsenii DSM 44353]UBI05621.1 site-specific DNA-methyltransferase [Corynebacterium falsenii]
MEKLRMTSPDLTEANIDKLAELFPTVVTETLDAVGNPQRAVDFDLLRQELSDHVVEGPQERYRLDWPGKRAAAFTANAPIAKTLRPVREESVEFDTTKNLFIEGDNLDALKLLQESYLGKVKMIYIDPPYNTGNDFLYADDFAESAAEYLERTSQKSETGDRLVANPESNGRFNSDWLSMLYPRLKLSRSLLSEDGAIFVSCDYHESGNLKCLLDEVFGRTNLVAEFIWQHSVQPKGYTDTVSVHHNTIFCYRRTDSFALQPLERTAEHNKNYRNPDNDPRGPWRAGDVRNALYRPNLRYPLPTPRGGTIDPPENGWRWSKETIEKKIATGEIIFNEDETSITRKIYLDTLDGRAVESLWLGTEVGTTREAANEVKKLFGGKALFDTPKPTKLMERIMWIAGVGDGDLVLDFFAGSGTTADAVFRANSKDGKRRSWILVQIAEPVPSSSEAAKAGFSDIATLSRERIKRAGTNTISNNMLSAGASDIGFRAVQIDSTGLSNVAKAADDTDQLTIEELEPSIKNDRTAEDLLFQVLLDWGLELTMPIVKETVDGHEIFDVEEGALIACFEKSLIPEVVHSIATRHPIRAVFRDDGFASDAARINAEQIFREVSPSTEVKAI